jgi:hypothetical protein
LLIISSGFFIRNQIPGGVSSHSDGGGKDKEFSNSLNSNVKCYK